MTIEAEELKTEMVRVVATFHDEIQAAVPKAQAPLSEHGLLVAALHAGCHRLYRGIHELMNVWLDEEALILCRTLIEDSVTLVYFLGNKEGSDEMLHRFQYSSYLHEVQLEEEAQELGFPDAVERLDQRKRELPALEQRAKELGFQKPKGLPNVKQMLEAIKKPKRYWMFRRASHAIHTSRVALASRMIKNSEGYSIGLHKNPANLAAVMLIASDAMLWAHTATCLLLGWQTEDEIEELEKRLRVKLEGAAKSAGLDANAIEAETETN